MPLTADRAKPAVPFGGIYRLIDFALSNVVNSGYLKVVVLTQYKSHSLDRHVTTTWRMSTLLGNYVAPVPAQQRVGKHWYLGSADAIFQTPQPDHRRAARHRRRRRRRPRLPDGLLADGRRARRVRRRRAPSPAIRQPIALADQFGVIDVDPDDPQQIRAFLEKPTDPVGPARLPRRGARVAWATTSSPPTRSSTRVTRDAELEQSKHDMGGDIVPWFVDKAESRRLRLQGQRRARLDRPRPRLLARRRDDATPTTTRTWTSSRRCRSSTSTTTTGRSTPATARTRRPSSSRAPAAPGSRRSTRSSRPASSSAAAPSTSRCCRRRCASRTAPRSPTRC